MSPAARRRLLLSLMIYFSLANHAASLSFNFDFSNASTFSLADLTTAGVAAFHGGLFDLTANSYGANLSSKVGRVTYARPVPLWDNATGEVASFTTSFSFTINITDMNNKGDGMAFFLGHYPSVLPPNSEGFALGLCTHNCDNTNVVGEDRFVAVEFDTFERWYSKPQ